MCNLTQVDRISTSLQPLLCLKLWKYFFIFLLSPVPVFISLLSSNLSRNVTESKHVSLYKNRSFVLVSGLLYASLLSFCSAISLRASQTSFHCSRTSTSVCGLSFCLVRLQSALLINVLSWKIAWYFPQETTSSLLRNGFFVSVSVPHRGWARSRSPFLLIGFCIGT